jgi:hypothetical protein
MDRNPHRTNAPVMIQANITIDILDCQFLEFLFSLLMLQRKAKSPDEQHWNAYRAERAPSLRDDSYA